MIFKKEKAEYINANLDVFIKSVQFGIFVGIPAGFLILYKYLSYNNLESYVSTLFGDVSMMLAIAASAVVVTTLTLTGVVLSPMLLSIANSKYVHVPEEHKQYYVCVDFIMLMGVALVLVAGGFVTAQYYIAIYVGSMCLYIATKLYVLRRGVKGEQIEYIWDESHNSSECEKSRAKTHMGGTLFYIFTTFVALSLFYLPIVMFLKFVEGLSDSLFVGASMFLVMLSAYSLIVAIDMNTKKANYMIVIAGAFLMMLFAGFSENLTNQIMNKLGIGGYYENLYTKKVSMDALGKKELNCEPSAFDGYTKCKAWVVIKYKNSFVVKAKRETDDEYYKLKGFSEKMPLLD